MFCACIAAFTKSSAPQYVFSVYKCFSKEASTIPKVESEAPVDWFIIDFKRQTWAGGRTYSHVTPKICRRELLWKAILNTGIILSGLTTLPSSTRSSSSSLSVELSAWAVGILETVDRLCRFCLLFWLYVKHNDVIRAVRILNVRFNILWVQPLIKINSTFVDISLLELFTVWIWGFYRRII